MTAITIPNTFLPSTTISSTAMNQNFTEVADAIEASVAIDGSETMTGVLKLANGTAANPSLTFGSDTNLGIYRKTTDELAFTTAGVLAAHIDAAGKLWLAAGLDVATDVDIGGDATIDGSITVTTGIELGHASDTTLSRLGAGSVGVEGTALLRASQNLSDVGTAATAFSNIKQAATDEATGVLEIAIQSEMETGTSTSLAVTPGRQAFHPAHPKAWAYVTVSGGTPSLAASHNVTGITDAGVGELTVTIATDFSSANWACPCAGSKGAGAAEAVRDVGPTTQAAGSVLLGCANHLQDAVDPDAWHMTGLGDLA